MRFEYYRDKQKQWRWRLKAANNETVASGEGYKRKIDCIHAIRLIQDLAKSAPITPEDNKLTGKQ